MDEDGRSDTLSDAEVAERWWSTRQEGEVEPLEDDTQKLRKGENDVPK